MKQLRRMRTAAPSQVRHQRLASIQCSTKSLIGFRRKNYVIASGRRKPRWLERLSAPSKAIPLAKPLTNADRSMKYRPSGYATDCIDFSINQIIEQNILAIKGNYVLIR
jgi:hypothetical protein